jgi:hypothetical protein
VSPRLVTRLACASSKTSQPYPPAASMPPKLRAPENVWTYPRPARAERTAARLRVVWTDAQGTETTLADTTDGYRVLETSHPPTVSRAAWLCRRHRL